VLKVCVLELRRALGDDARDPRWHPDRATAAATASSRALPAPG
jgi:hypothetical protein